MIPLFDEQIIDRSSPRSFIASFVLHVSVSIVLVEALAHNPLIIDAAIPIYKAQIVDLHVPMIRMRVPSLPAAISDLKEKQGVQKKNEEKEDAAMHAESAAQKDGSSPQTLLRPTKVTHALSEEVPLPALLMVSKIDDVANRVSPPMQPQVMPNAKPELEMPIDEDVSDIRIQSSTTPDNLFPLTASTTSPVASQYSVNGDRLPKTPSESKADATSTDALSISDVHLADGTNSLPMTNEVAGAGRSGTGSAGSEQQAYVYGIAKSGSGNGTGGDAKEARGTRHVTLPKNGQFGMVVVGASLEELYPQTAGIWGSRLAYTVFLNVGTARRWILQYSQQDSATSNFNGKPKRIEPPWPTDVVVPNVEGEINADALLIHGYLNASGRFENLAVAFPPGFRLSKFVLDSLQQWQFRPAKQDGVAASVEILLIIP